MKRKVIQIADSTQLVSLPRKWAQSHNILKGDELEVTEQGNHVIISTEKDVSAPSISIDVSQLSFKVVKWLIVALYKSGYDEIEVKFENPETTKAIQDMISEVLGFVIIEQTDKRCVIKNISKGIEEEFDSTLRRNFLVVLSLSKSTFDMFKDGNYRNMPDVAKLEKTNNQLTSFCHRILNTRGFKDPKKTSYVYVIIKLMEGVADKYRDICNYFAEPKNKNYKPGKRIIGIFSEANSLVETFYHLFYKFEDIKIVEITEKKKKIMEESYRIMAESKKEADIFVTNCIMGITNGIADTIGSYLGLNF